MTTEKITCELVEAGFIGRRTCTVCGHVTEKREILVEARTGAGVILVCEECLEAGDLDERLELHAQTLDDQAAALRDLKGRLVVPSFAAWHAKEGEGYADGMPYNPRWYVGPGHPERQELLTPEQIKLIDQHYAAKCCT